MLVNEPKYLTYPNTIGYTSIVINRVLGNSLAYTIEEFKLELESYTSKGRNNFPDYDTYKVIFKHSILKVNNDNLLDLRLFNDLEGKSLRTIKRKIKAANDFIYDNAEELLANLEKESSAYSKSFDELDEIIDICNEDLSGDNLIFDNLKRYFKEKGQHLYSDEAKINYLKRNMIKKKDKNKEK